MTFDRNIPISCCVHKMMDECQLPRHIARPRLEDRPKYKSLFSNCFDHLIQSKGKFGISTQSTIKNDRKMVLPALAGSTLNFTGQKHSLMATSLGATTPSVSFSSSSSNIVCFSNYALSIKLHNSYSAPTLTLNSLPLSSLPLLSKKKFFKFELYSTVREVAVEETQEGVPLEKTQEQEGSSDEKKKKLFIVNLPWSYAVSDIKKLLGECGTVKDVEIIKAKDGRHKGYAFITMASADQAQAVIDKFDSYVGIPSVETRHKLYVTNLSWKARASHLREFFSAECNPVSARVVFNGPSSTGYGFVSFATKEEAEAAISSMDGKELMGRPIRLKFSEKTMDGSGNELEENSSSGGQKEAEDSTNKPEES